MDKRKLHFEAAVAEYIRNGRRGDYCVELTETWVSDAWRSLTRLYGEPKEVQEAPKVIPPPVKKTRQRRSRGTLSKA